MKSVKLYGESPYRVAVLHGGPGAPGYMAPVARELSDTVGVAEPLQSANSLSGQIEELTEQLTTRCDLPVTVIGSSWGAVLALLAAARLPSIVKKLILVGCAVFDADSSSRIEGIRLSRLNSEQQDRHDRIMERLQSEAGENRDSLMKEWGELLDKTDMYDPLSTDLETIEVQSDVFSRVWPQFVELRDTPGALAEEFSRVACPVLVIHGDYDPHPLSGIQPFLKRWLRDVRFEVLLQCGHYPWLERQASERFYELLRYEL